MILAALHFQVATRKVKVTYVAHVTFQFGEAALEQDGSLKAAHA